jgi:hypothetical protein
MANLDLVIGRVKSEFNEMPGLRLSVRQAMRLWGLERVECERVIDALVNESFLKLNASGDVLRVGSGPPLAARTNHQGASS